MLAVQLNLCVGAGAPSAPSSEGGEAATAAYHSITSVPHIHKMCRHGRHTFVFHAPEGRASFVAQPQKKAPRGAFFAYYILSGTVMLSTVSTFLIVFFAARQRVIRASISAQSSQRQRQAL